MRQFNWDAPAQGLNWLRKHRLDNICLSMYYSAMVSHTKSIDKTHSKAGSKTAAANIKQIYTAETYTPEKSVGYLIRRITALLGQELEHEFEPCGLTNAQWVPLLKLYWGHASTVAELARGCDLDAGSMTRLLDRLEAKQLLRRVRSSDDRRVVNLELTDAGRTVASGIPDVLCQIQNEHLVGFSQAEWETLVNLLTRILDTAQARAASNDKSHQPISEPVASEK
jgi:DNA-binding MarR family transcriptional regulator